MARVTRSGPRFPYTSAMASRTLPPRSYVRKPVDFVQFVEAVKQLGKRESPGPQPRNLALVAATLACLGFAAVAAVPGALAPAAPQATPHAPPATTCAR